MKIRKRPAATLFSRILDRIRRFASPAFRLGQFELAPLDFDADELVLDEIISEYERDPRVVPIYAGAAPGELCDRIEKHFHAEVAQRHSRTAADELSDALAELRRSIR